MNQRFVCMLALEDTGPVSVHDLSDRLARMFPTHPMKIETVPGESLDDPLISLLLLVNEFPIAVMWVDRPIPLDTFDSAIRTNRLWPQARERLRGHKAYIMVGALDSCKSHQEAVQQATLVMLLSAAARLATNGAIAPMLAEEEKARMRAHIFRHPAWG